MKPPKLRNDCFALPQGVDWTPVDDALAHLRANLHAVTRTEEVAVPQAGGRVLAADLAARRSHPPRANSAVDGYGFAGASAQGTLNELPLVPGRAAAGAPFAGDVRAGQAIRILTGAELPAGVDTVVLEEDCATDGARVAFRGPLKSGANTRRAGEDKAKGASLLPRGRRITAGDIALLTATGHIQVPVHARLRVGVMSTGDELAAAGAEPAPGQIADANRPMLLQMLADWGHIGVDLGALADNPGAIRSALDAAAADCDAILTSGGASAGDEDHVSALLQAGGTQSLWRIAMKPGRPLSLALWAGVPVFGLPGNPVAAFVCALIFGRPALSVLAGGGWQEAATCMVPAAFDKSKKPGRREFLRARLNAEGAAEVFASEGSGRISGLSWATGLVDLPHEAVVVAPGDPVRFIAFSD